MRRLFLGLVLLFWPPLLLGQFTQTQGTIKDPTGLPYSNGTITPTLVCSASPRFASSGFPYTPPAQPVGLDANGSFVMQLADVTQLTPSGCTWSFHTCSAAGTIQPGTPISGGPICFDVTGLAISGTVEDISSQLSAAAPRLGTGGTGGGATIPNGTTGQFLQYTSASTVAGSPNLFMNGSNGTTVTSTSPFAITNGTTTAALSIGTPANLLALSISGGTTRFLMPVLVNGQQISVSNPIAPNNTYVNFNGTNANPPVCNPAAPPNGRCITFSLTGGSAIGMAVSAALVGDGVATDCFLGNGTFGPCPGTGAGSTPISALTAATSANTISNGDNSQVWNWNLTTAGNSGLNISEDGTASTGSGSSLVKISQPTAGTSAVALTVQSGSSALAVPAVQIQNTASQNTVTIGSEGSISVAGSYQSLTTTGLGQLCGGQCGTSNAATAGGVRVKGSDNTSSGPTASGGYAILNAGGLTSGTGVGATAVNNVTQVASPYFCSGTCTLSTVLCATGSLDSVNACSITPQSQVVGISEGSSSTTTWAVTAGAAQVRVDNTAVIGHTLCTSTANAGAATDSGGTAGCTFGQQIGVVMAVSGSATIPSGTGQTTVTFSAAAPKVALSLASGGTGSVGAGNAGAFAFYPALGNSVVGSANLLDSNGTINSAEPFTAPNLQLSNPSGTLSGVGGTLTPVAGRGAFGFSATGTPAISRFGGTFQQLLTPSVNGTAVVQQTGLQTNFDLNDNLPAAPANGRNISWQQVTNQGTISGALVGDGSTNCLSGQGTYVPCGSGGGGGSGTVGNGTAGQFAFYSTTGNSVVGTSSISNNGALILTTLPFATVAGVIPGSGISQIGNAPTGGQIGFLQGNVGTSTFIPFFGFDVNGSAVVTTAPAPFVNLNAATPPAPTNGKSITFAVSGNNVSGSIVGDGTLNCLSGQGTYVSCGGTTGAVSGSGTATHLPVWSSANTLADSAVTFTGTTSVPTNVNFASTSTPLQPTAGAGIGGFIINRSTLCPASGTTAGPAFNRIGVSDIGCLGTWLSYTQTLGAGQNAGLLVSSGNGSNGNLGMGIASLASPGSSLTEERAGYFQALSTGGLASTNRGMYAVALNIGNSSVAMPLNEAIVAQTGNTLDAGLSASPTTADYTVHVLQPLLGSPAVAGQLMTTHAGMRIEPQTLGVEFQTGAHTFGALPACTSTYEGSFAAITDSLTATGTITGGGTFHVLGYCDGTNWTANGGSGGGGGTAGVTSINTVPGAFTFSGAGVACSGTTCAFGGGTGSGTVGAGVGHQFAIYNGTGTAVVGTPNLLDSPTGVAELTAEVPILPTAGIVLSTNQIGNLPTTPQIVSGGNSTPPAALSAGISGFAFGAAPAPGGSNIPLVNQNAGGWFPVTTTSVNAAQLSTTNADFNSTTPAAPANGINVTWQKTTPAAGGTSTSLSAAVVGDGLATDCLVGTGVFVPCPGGGVTPPPRTVVGICPATGTVSAPATTGGNCTITFSPAFVNPPSCIVTPIDQTPASPIHVINWQIGGPNSANTSAFSITFSTNPAATVQVIFNFICMGNPN